MDYVCAYLFLFWKNIIDILLFGKFALYKKFP